MNPVLCILLADVINGVIALLALVAVIISVYTIKKANESGAMQQFETTFFNFLQLQRTIISELAITVGQPPHEKTYVGKYYLKYIYEEIFRKNVSSAERTIQLQVIGQDQRREELIHQSRSIERILPQYISAYNAHNNSLGHYFRSLYHLVRLVDDAAILKDHELKMKYIRLIRSQLSIYETALLFYNGLSENGRHKFKPLIEKYHLLKNLDDSALVILDHKRAYSASAFGKNYQHPQQ